MQIIYYKIKNSNIIGEFFNVINNMVTLYNEEKGFFRVNVNSIERIYLIEKIKY